MSEVPLYLTVEVAHDDYSDRERSSTAIQKDAGLYYGSRLRKGEVFAYVGLPHNLKDVTATPLGYRALAGSTTP